MKIDVTHSVWQWIAEQAGFLLTRLEGARDGKKAFELLRGTSAKLHGLFLAEGILVEKGRRAGGPPGDVDVQCILGVKATTGEVIVGEPKWSFAHKNGPEEDSEAKMGTKQSGDDRGVPWRKNEEDEARCGAKEGVYITSGVTARVHAVAQRAGEASAHNKLPKVD